jgi:hypothetical protein
MQSSVRVGHTYRATIGLDKGMVPRVVVACRGSNGTLWAPSWPWRARWVPPIVLCQDPTNLCHHHSYIIITVTIKSIIIIAFVVGSWC